MKKREFISLLGGALVPAGVMRHESQRQALWIAAAGISGARSVNDRAVFAVPSED
jgi:hypothetical protein